MKEQLVGFEVAKRAKEKGFDIKCINHFTPKGKFRFCHPEDPNYSFRHSNEGWVEAPTQALLQKWLREVHQIIIFVQHEIIDDSESAFTYTIKKYVKEGLEGSRKKDEPDFWYVKHSFLLNSGWWNVYEEALEEALLRGLKLLPDT